MLTTPFMPDAEMWTLIEEAKRLAPESIDRHADLLSTALARLDDDDIFAFARTLYRYLNRANLHEGLFAALSLILNHHCLELSDDTWLYFSGWLVAQGRTTHDQLSNHPDALADHAANLEYLLDGELMRYVHVYALQKKGKDITDEQRALIEDPNDASLDPPPQVPQTFPRINAALANLPRK
jgi:hypothetical protein